MTRRVRLHPDFEADVRRHVGWLTRERGSDWIVGLRDGIARAIDLLEEFPALGSAHASDGGFVVRNLLLRRLPYVVWYVYDASDERGDLWLMRLFHVRQRQPRLSARQWRRRLFAAPES